MLELLLHAGRQGVVPVHQQVRAARVGNFTGSAPLPSAPTTAAPGTPEKLAVLEMRAKMKQAIFHPADARFEGDPRPLEFLKNKSRTAAKEMACCA